MERLPPELYDLIVLYIAGQPPILALKLVNHNPAFPLEGSCDPDQQHDKRRFKQDRRSLATLRLVNKSFCRSASRLLFWQLRFSKYSSITRLEEFSKSQYAPYVREIICTFDCWRESIYWIPCRTDWLFYLDVCAQKLQARLAGFPNLRAIRYQMDYILSDDSGKAQVTAVIMVNPSRERRLTELKICLAPFGIIDLILSDEMKVDRMSMKNKLQHLRHLEIVIDGSNQGLELMDEVQIADVSTLLEAADNLSSLHLDSSNIYLLEFGIKSLNPSIRLEYLDCSVFINCHQMLILLRQCKETIRYLYIGAGLESPIGVWLYVLYHIHKHLKLLDFETPDDELVDREYDRFYVIPEAVSAVDDEDYLAVYAIGDIQRQVNANRLAAGLEPHSEPMYNRLQLPPLKSVMEESIGKKLDSTPWYPID